MQRAVQGILSSIPQQCDPNLLHIAGILAAMSTEVYSSMCESHVSLQLPVVSGPDVFIRGELLCSKLASDGHVQFGIWRVDDIGLIVAFRGTRDANDVFVDINFDPVSVTGSTGLELHGSIYRRIAPYVPEIEGHYCRNGTAAVGLPLYLTGSSSSCFVSQVCSSSLSKTRVEVR